MARNLARSSNGTERSSAWASTRSLKSSQESSRLTYRASSDPCRGAAGTASTAASREVAIGSTVAAAIALRSGRPRQDRRDSMPQTRARFHDRLASLPRALLVIGHEVQRAIPDATDAWLRRDVEAARSIDARTAG